MSIILITGAGLGLGSFISWLVEQKPHFLVSSESIKEHADSGFSFIPFLFVVGLGLNFYGLSLAGFSTSQTACYGFFIAIIWAAAFFDIRYRLIPNRLLIIGVVGWMCFASLGIITVLPSLLAGACSAALILLIRQAGFLFYQKAGMGIGDIKIVFLIGIYLQWEVFWVIYLAVLAGGAWAIGGLILKKLDRSGKLPFAPFLWIAVSIAVFVPFNEFISTWV